MFVEQLTDNQFEEILNMISDDGEVKEFTINKSKVPYAVKATFNETKETYFIDDYFIKGVGFAGAGSDFIYRQKMYEWFGKEYAVNFLMEY